jgi:hypothetical protein
MTGLNKGPAETELLWLETILPSKRRVLLEPVAVVIARNAALQLHCSSAPMLSVHERR